MVPLNQLPAAQDFQSCVIELRIYDPLQSEPLHQTTEKVHRLKVKDKNILAAQDFQSCVIELRIYDPLHSEQLYQISQLFPNESYRKVHRLKGKDKNIHTAIKD